MKESKRQLQVADTLQKYLYEIFIKLNLHIIQGEMVSISKIKVTPDLLEVWVYLSFFKLNNTENNIQYIQSKDWEIKKMLAEKMKNNFRRIPVLKYFVDDTLDYVFKMEEIFDKLKDENK